MFKKTRLGFAALLAVGMFTMAGCAGDAEPVDAADDASETSETTSEATEDSGSEGDTGSEGGDYVVGFVAVGPEGGWRTANEKDVQEAFKAAGIELKYTPSADGDQKSQLDAMDQFISDEVDAIVLSATEATGWEDSLAKAQEAEIPVVLLDRGIEPDDDSLYTSHIGPSNIEAGAAAAEFANEQAADGAIKAVVLEGIKGLSVVNDRNKGWNDNLDTSKVEVLESQTANWSTAEGKTVTEGFLDKYDNDIQVIFAQNDEMGLGAAQAVEAKGLTPGTDVKIITIDGTKPALEALIDGQLSFVIEYNPIFGEKAVEVVLDAIAGNPVEQHIVVESATFTAADAEKVIDSRPY